MRRILFLVVISAALPSPVFAFQVARFVIGNGAAPAAGATGTGLVVRATAGQTAVGTSSAPGSVLRHGYWHGGSPGGTVSVEPETAADGGAELALRFAPPSPNPARGPVSFAFTLPRAAAVRVVIADVQGRRVGSLDPGRLPAGAHRLRWEGTGSSPSAAGVYFARLEVEGRTVGVHRMVVRR